MSMMNCAEAVQAVLDAALDRSNELMVIHVDGGAESEPAWGSRRLNLPLTDDAQFDFALGCAQAGMLPVLDLRALTDGEERLREALLRVKADELRPMIVRLCGRTVPSLPGVRVIAPRTPSEAAGAMRYALQAASLCAVVENPLTAYDACDVPDEPDGPLFCGWWLTPGEPDMSGGENKPDAVSEAGGAAESGEFAERNEPDGSADAAQDGSADAQADFEEADESVREAAPARGEPDENREDTDDTEDRRAGKSVKAAETPRGADAAVQTAILRETACRTRGYDPAELERTANLLELPRDELTRLCCEKTAETAEVLIETDSEPGETAVIPPTEKAACLWVGSDRLSLCWRTDEMSAQDARALLNHVSALLAVPARLILEGKN